ncbi:hypothetical protein F4861DRAFT_252885 [Xylaria intraflava]|nr:hypothetical protein F4861DRAFT_252885 [Xylaria intraflava]
MYKTIRLRCETVNMKLTISILLVATFLGQAYTVEVAGERSTTPAVIAPITATTFYVSPSTTTSGFLTPRTTLSTTSPTTTPSTTPSNNAFGPILTTSPTTISTPNTAPTLSPITTESLIPGITTNLTSSTTRCPSWTGIVPPFHRPHIPPRKYPMRGQPALVKPVQKNDADVFVPVLSGASL